MLAYVKSYNFWSSDANKNTDVVGQNNSDEPTMLSSSTPVLANVSTIDVIWEKIAALIEFS